MRYPVRFAVWLAASGISAGALALAAPVNRIPHIGTRAQPAPPSAVELPLDKPYQQLTEPQKDIVRSWYEDLGANDEPPFPVNGMAPLMADIATVQRRVQVQGRFFAAAHVDDKGNAKTVTIYDIPDARLKQVLAFILIKTKYKPAKCNGKPCAMDFPIEAGFEQPATPAQPEGR